MYTGPTQFVHLHSHSLYSTLDGVASPEQYAEQCAARGYPAMSATEHGHMASVPDMYLAFKKAKVKFIAGCFLPSQPILTNNGVKPISEVIPGIDSVLTHNALFKTILNIQVREYGGELIRLKAWGVEDQLCTPEHPFLVREVTRTEVKLGVWDDCCVVKWMKAAELRREKYSRTYATKRSQDRSNKRRYRHYLCVPRMNGNGIGNIWLPDHIFSQNSEFDYLISNGNIESVVYSQDSCRTTKKVNLPAHLTLDKDLLWVMGLWLAEGSLGSGGPNFSLGADGYEFYERIADYFAGFGINTSFRFRYGESESRPRHALDVQVYSIYFNRLFESLFKSGFAHKRIPTDWLMGLSEDEAKSFLGGLFDGDAKIGDRSSYLKLNNQTLVWQVRLLMTKFAEPQYPAITELNCNNSNNNSFCLRKRESGHFYYDYDARYIYLPIYDMQKDEYHGQVFNIEVEGDNSYYTGVIAHNCEIYYNDWEPKRQELEASGVKVRSPEWRQSNVMLGDRIFRNRHLTVLCKNQTGFHNLVRLTTQAYNTGLFGLSERQFNRVWFEKLCEYKEGLIILSGCLNGPLCHELRYKEVKDRAGNIVAERPLRERLDAAVTYLKKFRDVFGDDYYIELQMPGVENDAWVFRTLIALADQFKIPVVLANDCHYMQRKDFQLQKIMMAIAQETTVDDPNLFHVNSDEQYMKTRAELWSRFKNFDYSKGIDDRKFEEMCDNSLMVADKCQPLKFDADPKIPHITNADKVLKELVVKRLVDGGFNNNQRKFLIDGKMVTYVEQAGIELRRFIDKGFASYFLITQDLISYGREQGWPFSPRGSAGGSLVCFLLGIHAIDPLLWGLSFDRFLSPSRGGYMLNLAMGDEKKG